VDMFGVGVGVGVQGAGLIRKPDRPHCQYWLGPWTTNAQSNLRLHWFEHHDSNSCVFSFLSRHANPPYAALMPNEQPSWCSAAPPPPLTGLSSKRLPTVFFLTEKVSLLQGQPSGSGRSQNENTDGGHLNHIERPIPDDASPAGGSSSRLLKAAHARVRDNRRHKYRKQGP